MTVSIIIVNYNQKNFLKECLKNILEAKINLDYEIIIVDNNSRDSSKEFLTELSVKNDKIKIILNKKNFGFAKANNQGIKKARGKYVLILNPDVIVLPGAIEQLYQFMETHPEVGIAGPQLLNPNKTIQYSCLRFPCWYMPIFRRTILGKLPIAQKALKKYLMTDFDHQIAKPVDWLLGACLMIRKDVLEKIWFFDERFFLYFDDVDLARRVWQAGFKVYYFPPAKMYHFHQRLSVERSKFPFLFSKVTWVHCSSAIKYFQKWHKTKYPSNHVTK